MSRRLLVLGDGGSPTGYARVIHSIVRSLPKGEYEVHHLAVNYLGDPHGEEWSLYPAGARGDIFGLNRIRELVDKVQPELVFSVADLWIQKLYLESLAACPKSSPVVVYSPVDAGPVDPEWVEGFPRASRVVAFTAFARAEIEKAIKPDGSHEIEVIPLGVDSDVFHPLRGPGQSGAASPWETAAAKLKLGLFSEDEVRGCSRKERW